MKKIYALIQKKLQDHFNRDNQTIYTKNDLNNCLLEFEKNFLDSEQYPINSFIDDLLELGILILKQVIFPNHTYNLYVKQKPIDAYEFAHKITLNTYFSHLSAICLHNLTTQNPISIYISQNKNQSSLKNSISQDAIDRAFESKTRVSNSFARVILNKDPYNIFLLNGSATTKTGLDTLNIEGQSFSCTSLERTLIDICVRPEYSGGTEIVNEAYREAAEKVSVNKLKSILLNMNMTYPYHQAIGFLMDYSGKYKDTQLDILKRLPITNNFYLMHGISRDELYFDNTWKIYYPKFLGIK